MTFRERQEALLADLIAERAQFGERWHSYYDGKIAEMQEAINGSGKTDQSGGSPIVQDVPGSASQALREDRSTDGTVPL